MLEQITARQLLKKKYILLASREDTLVTALDKLRSSHDAVFVAEDGHYFGVISPYHALFRSFFPPETKLKKCLYGVPKIALDTPLPEIARLMSECKVYYLPVFDADDNWVGIVTKARIMKMVSKYFSEIAKELNKVIVKKSVVTVSADLRIDQAKSLMEKKKISILVVVNDKNRLLGVLSRYDLRVPLSDKTGERGSLNRIGNKINNLDEPIGDYMTKMVVTLPWPVDADTVMKTLVKKNVGCVVLVDKEERPVGLVTVGDLLEVITGNAGDSLSELSFKISVTGRFIQLKALERIVAKKMETWKRKYELENAEVKIKTVPIQSGKIKQLEVSMSVEYLNKKVLAKESGREWRIILGKVMDKVEHQLSRLAEE